MSDLKEDEDLVPAPTHVPCWMVVVGLLAFLAMVYGFSALVIK